ncbi:hypothetical protein [Rothia dentocariosa]|uniref:hypothetical protein n=1 Tax=Rothia dentocariosa TaxID=2047 RepID=UPI002490B7C9|nr:hypothetical protein [Rothia dentocariosa]
MRDCTLFTQIYISNISLDFVLRNAINNLIGLNDWDSVSKLLIQGLDALDSGQIYYGINLLKLISENIDLEIFTQALHMIGIHLYLIKIYPEAINHSLNVRHDVIPWAYAEAQNIIGISYRELGNTYLAIQHWENVSHADSPSSYAKAQFNLGLEFQKVGELELAAKHFGNVREEDDPEVYGPAKTLYTAVNIFLEGR